MGARERRNGSGSPAARPQEEARLGAGTLASEQGWVLSRIEQPLPDKEKRIARRARHAIEVEASQASLRANIAEAERLVGESDKMLRRHRQECDDDDAAEDAV